MPLNILLWNVEGDTPIAAQLTVPKLLSANSGDHAGVTVAAIEPADDFIAVVLIPADRGSQVARNGALLPAGIHGLKHTVRLDVGDQSYWVSAESQPVDDQYDADRHGADQFCTITKARLVLDTPITICPGTPSSPCQAIYKRAVWNKAIQSPRGFKCPHCGYRPGANTWKPSLKKPSKRLERLMAVIGQEAQP